MSHRTTLLAEAFDSQGWEQGRINASILRSRKQSYSEEAGRE